jgi:FeS assembly SUF system protein
MKLSKLLKTSRQKPAAAGRATAPKEALPASQSPSEARAPEACSAAEIEQAVIEVLRTVFDPEIPVNIYELGLVYAIDVDAQGRVLVQMTLTSPGCPVAGSLIPEIEQKVLAVAGVTDVVVELVWEPPWDPSRMTDAARLQLNMF